TLQFGRTSIPSPVGSTTSGRSRSSWCSKARRKGPQTPAGPSRSTCPAGLCCSSKDTQSSRNSVTKKRHEEASRRSVTEERHGETSRGQEQSWPLTFFRDVVSRRLFVTVLRDASYLYR